MDSHSLHSKRCGYNRAPLVGLHRNLCNLSLPCTLQRSTADGPGADSHFWYPQMPLNPCKELYNVHHTMNPLYLLDQNIQFYAKSDTKTQQSTFQ